MEWSTHNRTSEGGPDIASSDTDGADGQETELTLQLLLVARGIDYLAHADGVVVRLQTRLLILVETHSR